MSAALDQGVASGTGRRNSGLSGDRERKDSQAMQSALMEATLRMSKQALTEPPTVGGT
jgi:hypothetical protein